MEDVTLEFRRGRRLEIVVAALVLFWSTALWLVWTARSAAARKGRERRLPPGPKGWPLIGALPYLGEFPHRSFTDMAKKYGPIMYMNLGSTPTLIVASAEMAKEVFKTNDQVFASRPTMVVPTYLFHGNQDIGFAPYGPHWRQARKVVNMQLLTQTKLAHFMGVIKGEILSTIHNVLELPKSAGKEYANVDLINLFGRAAMNIITQMMWSKRYYNVKGDDSHDDEAFHQVCRTAISLLGMNNVADFMPSSLKPLAMTVSGLKKKVLNVRDNLGELCQNVICEREQILSKQGSTHAVADDDDFLSILLKLKNESGESAGLSKEAIQSILFDLVLAGIDTSTVTLGWIFTEIMKHPDIMKKLQNELRTVVGEDRLVSELDLPRLKYLDAVVKEAFRLHTAGPLGVPHQSIADCKVGGYDVPASTLVLVNMYAIHRDERVWDKPLEFNPDRFLQSSLDYKGRNYEFIPFGSGRRICPGIGLASTLLRFGLAQFVHTISWSLPNGQGPDDVDFTESSGLALCRATPLIMNAKPNLAHHVIFPTK